MNQKILFPEIVITKLKWTYFNFLKADFLNNKDTAEISMSLWEIDARSEEWDIILGNEEWDIILGNKWSCNIKDI